MPFSIVGHPQKRKISSEEVAVTPNEVAAAIGKLMDINTALSLVITKSIAHGGLARGLREAAKAIEEQNAHLCLCKIDSRGKARKVVGCACVVVKDYGEQHEAVEVV
ncbi:hypothetical protein DITRI_Ditri10aG0125100 [Diplodiscus trichospermus]